MELEEESALAEAGVAGDHHHLPAPFPRLLEALAQHRQLARPADERREPALGGDVQARAAAAGPEHLEGARGGAALGGDLPEIQRLEIALDGGVGCLADHHAARPGRLLHAGSEVRRVADRGVVHAQVIADLADHHRTGVETDPELKADILLRLELAVKNPDRALNPERRVNGAARAVLVGDRRAEECHHAVAGVLVHAALEAVDFGADGGKAAVDERVHVFGIARLGQRREAGEVGEEHGDLTTFAFERRARLEDLLRQMPRRVWLGPRPPRGHGGGGRGVGRRRDGAPADRRAAGAAEARTRPESRAAPGAPRLQRDAALIAEAVTLRVGGAALGTNHPSEDTPGAGRGAVRRSSRTPRAE